MTQLLAGWKDGTPRVCTQMIQTMCKEERQTGNIAARRNNKHSVAVSLPYPFFELKSNIYNFMFLQLLAKWDAVPFGLQMVPEYKGLIIHILFVSGVKAFFLKCLQVQNSANLCLLFNFFPSALYPSLIPCFSISVFLASVKFFGLVFACEHISVV